MISANSALYPLKKNLTQWKRLIYFTDALQLDPISFYNTNFHRFGLPYRCNMYIEKIIGTTDIDEEDCENIF